MAYASFYDTHETELRFKCLEWSVYLNSLNRDIDFLIYEDKENMKIDFEIVLRNTQGVNINSFMVNDIDVSQELVNIMRHVINIHLHQFGLQVSIFFQFGKFVSWLPPKNNYQFSILKLCNLPSTWIGKS